MLYGGVVAMIARRTALTLSLTSLAACNSFLGIEDVSLAGDGGADDPDARQIDAAPDAPVDAAAPLRIGNGVQLGGSGTIPSDIDIARKISTPPDVTGDLVGFGVFTATAGGTMRLGLYSEGGTDEPDLFIFRTGNVVDFPAGEVIVDVAPGTVTLEPAADYWIAIAFDTQTSVSADSATQVRNCTASRPFAQAIPDTGFNADGCNNADAIGLFILVEVQ
jgi:hypothetical protein